MKYHPGSQSDDAGSAQAELTVEQLVAAVRLEPREQPAQPARTAEERAIRTAFIRHRTIHSVQTSQKIKTEIVSIRRTEIQPLPRRQLRRNLFRSLAVLPVALLLVLAVGFPSLRVGGPVITESVTLSAKFATMREAPATPEPVRTLTWSGMSEAQQAAFIADQAQRVSAMLGDNPHPLTADAVQVIKKYVAAYAERVNLPAHGGRVENLRSLFDRASSYAPVIVRAFRERRVPPVMGLYIPLIESEYRACLQSPYGATGLFQFMPASARAYGANAGDLCNAEKMAPVAAKYIADRITEFGTDARSMTLVLLSFNRNPDVVRRDLMQLRRADPDLDRSFWSLFANAHKLDSYFRNESRYYVPKFYAAAIVGENPETFGLQMAPLSMHEQ